ncbi:hypothetical protein O181_033807 [Austropuccinia psidii MF-1]|uniref:Uncharacterized protein n=1 Tax=Austropuccinia psidii MF-1 TaxID=1389203 RepID=A0A9Q3D232_9BASI|nr:hypothetical protein [Austropuccinia psidii MF-1]
MIENHFYQWINDIGSTHSTGLLTSSPSFHQPHGVRTLDNGKTLVPFHGRQCPNLHSNSQQSMVPTTWNPKNSIILSLTQSEPNRECLENHEECHQQTLSTTNN